MMNTLKATSLVLATNVRSAIAKSDLDEMKASILASGVIQNLVVAKGNVVIAGYTRATAVLELISEGKLPNDYSVPVLVRDDIDPQSADAIAIAITENVIRQEMDFIDQCLAMRQLADNGRDEGEIGALFGYTARTIRERLLIARLVPEALTLVRDKTRNLDWARALTMAHESLQKRIVEDVLSNPGAWRTADDIRAYLTKETIPADLAIFDLDDYTGPIIKDFFDGDKLADSQAFWDLQNAAISEQQANLEAQGYSVSVLRGEPFPEWLYENAPEGTKGDAIIEVMASGAVRVFTGKLRLQAMDAGAAHQDGPTLEIETDTDTLAAHEVRPTPRVLEYARTNRNTMVQAAVASDFETALRVNVLTMLNIKGGVAAAAPVSATSDYLRSNTAAWDMNDVNEQVRSLDAQANGSGARDKALVDIVMGMDINDVQTLFTQLTAQRAGQTRAALDDGFSLINSLGASIDVRAHWTPDEAFFNLMATEDLRRIGLALLPRMTGKKAATIKRKTLVNQLVKAFEDAKTGVIGGQNAQRLNTWVPGVMSFPAVLAEESAELDMDVSAEDALFS